ncbi:MAG TPA: CHASE3 domain-containing protein, partial [Bdellovibrionota bacterium]|nr:CHASE3 domain-containing protein [Bdellovibrionota bacterium]
MATLVLAAFGTRRDLDRLEALSEARHQGRETIQAIHSVSNLLVTAESGQRGYLLTGREDYLAPYTMSVKRIEGEVERLRRDFAGRPAELAKVGRVAELIALKLAELAETIAMRAKSGLRPALEVMLSDRGKIYMEEARPLLGSLLSAEQARVDDLAARSLMLISTSGWVTGLGSGLALAMVVVALALLARNRRRRREAERSLAQVVEAQHALASADLAQEKIHQVLAAHASLLTGADGAVIELVEGEEVVYRAASGTAVAQLGMRIPIEGSFS